MYQRKARASVATYVNLDRSVDQQVVDDSDTCTAMFHKALAERKQFLCALGVCGRLDREETARFSTVSENAKNAFSVWATTTRVKQKTARSVTHAPLPSALEESASRELVFGGAQQCIEMHDESIRERQPDRNHLRLVISTVRVHFAEHDLEKETRLRESLQLEALFALEHAKAWQIPTRVAALQYTQLQIVRAVNALHSTQRPDMDLKVAQRNIGEIAAAHTNRNNVFAARDRLLVRHVERQWI